MAGELNIRNGLIVSGSVETVGAGFGSPRIIQTDTSNTFSIDLSAGTNHYISLSNGDSKHLKCISGSSGQQFHIIVNTPAETATLSSHTNMKYVAEETYVASTSAAKDMLVGFVQRGDDLPDSYMFYYKNLGG